MIKTIVITGASDGIGLAAAKELKQRGHNVVLVGRNKEKTEMAASELNAPFHIADFSRLSDVEKLASELMQYPQIDVLANNAGALASDKLITADGFERTFQVNVLASFLLTSLLIDKLCKDRTIVIQTSSIASNIFVRDFSVDDLQALKGFTSTRAYGNSKLCNVLFTTELHRRYNEKGIKAVAFEPGISRSNFAAEGSFFLKTAYHTPLKYLFTISTKQSAKRLVRLALGKPDVDFVAGETYSYKKIYKVRLNKPDLAEAFWDKCEQMLLDYISTK